MSDYVNDDEIWKYPKTNKTTSTSNHIPKQQQIYVLYTYRRNIYVVGPWFCMKILCIVHINLKSVTIKLVLQLS